MGAVCSFLSIDLMTSRDFLMDGLLSDTNHHLDDLMAIVQHECIKILLRPF